MKRLFVILAGLALCLLAVLGCHKEPQPSEPTVVHVQNVSLDISTAELTVGGSQTIKVTITPSDATDKAVTFESSDNKVVTVDSNGKITAVGPGTATVTVRTKDGSKTATVTVTVKASEPSTVSVTGVKLDQNSLVLQVDGSASLTATVEPENATNKEVTWKSSAESVATVDANGKVTAIAPGMAAITVTTVDGGKTDACVVTVTEKPIAVTGIEFVYPGNLKTFPDDQVLARVRVLPEDATNKKYTWSASDPSIFTVSKIEETEEFDIIYVKGLKVGEAKLTVTTEDGGFTASDIVQVLEYVDITSLTLSPPSLNMAIDETAELTAIIEPDNATAKYVNWSTDNPDVAWVQPAGVLKAKVTANGVGTATLTATSVDGKKTATCVVTVSDPSSGPVAVTGITLNESSLELTAGDHVQLVATVQPSNATNQGVSWRSSNEGCCTVDNGYVTAINKGVATIYVQSDENPNIKTSCRINVAPPPVPVTGIKFHDSYYTGDITLIEGEKLGFHVFVLPEDASNKDVTYTISDPSVLKPLGVIYSDDYASLGVEALKEGNVTITATTVEGGYTATLDVKVLKYVAIESIIFDKTSITIKQGESAELNYTLDPEDASYPILDWTSSNPEVATVSGMYTSPRRIWGKSPGKTTITATSRVKDIKTATCEVTVLPATIPVTGLSLTPERITLDIDGTNTYQLTAAVEPSNADDQNIIWTSSKPDEVSVDENGLVTAHKEGGAIITATTEDGGFSKTCAVTSRKFRFSYSYGHGSYTMGHDPKTFTYIMGSNTESLGDAMRFFVSDGSMYTYVDRDASHWTHTVLSNDGCIEISKITQGSGSATYYYWEVKFKKNGHAKIRLSYDNGIVKLSQDISFDVYLDGSGKWKFRTYNHDQLYKDFTGTINAVLDERFILFQVTDLSNNPVVDLNRNHYYIKDLWEGSVIHTDIISQAVHGNNWYDMFIYYDKKGTAYVTASYTDGTYMITTGNFTFTVK